MESESFFHFIRIKLLWHQRHTHKKLIFLIKFSEKQIFSFNCFRHILEYQGPEI